MLTNMRLIQLSSRKKIPRKSVLQGEFTRRECNTSSTPQMWPLRNLSPKFTMNPENDHTQWERQQQVYKENILFTARRWEFCIALAKRRAFFYLLIMMHQPQTALVISEIKVFYKEDTSLSNNWFASGTPWVTRQGVGEISYPKPCCIICFTVW